MSSYAASSSTSRTTLQPRMPHPSSSYPPPPTPGAPRMRTIPLPPVDPRYAQPSHERTVKVSSQRPRPQRSAPYAPTSPPPSPPVRPYPDTPRLRTIPLPER